jgi:hypothetical protein
MIAASRRNSEPSSAGERADATSLQDKEGDQHDIDLPV